MNTSTIEVLRRPVESARAFSPLQCNSAWLQCAVLANNLIRWTATIGEAGPVDQLTVARTVRTRLIALPGRLVNLAGTWTLRTPRHWPWAEWFNRRLDRLRTLQPATG